MNDATTAKSGSGSPNSRTANRRTVRVLVHLGMRFKSGRAIAMGALRYAAAHKHLDVHVTEGKDERYDFLDFGPWRPDGLIADPWGSKAGAPRVRAKVLFHVSPEDVRGEDPGACVRMACDNVAVGRMAARLFERRNLRHFGFVGELHDFVWSVERRDAFRAALSECGLEAPSVFINPPGVTLARDRAALLAWLEALPKPCGVFVTSDLRAISVLDACRFAGIAVPETLQVLAVDNEEYLCEQTTPTLSSIEPDFESAGHEAMRLLDEMLGAHRVPPRGEGGDKRDRTPLPSIGSAPAEATAVSVPPLRTYGLRGFVERLSTRDFKGTARLVNIALDFIRQHGEGGATAAEVAKAAGCSARLLERHFRHTLGRTIVQELRRVKLEKARRLLRETETPIGEIGPLCGYEDEIHFRKLFKREFGLTMSAYRARPFA